MVKVARPNQDMRWDVPVVGIQTIEKLSENGYKALAIESRRMFLVQKKSFLEKAHSMGIIVQAV